MDVIKVLTRAISIKQRWIKNTEQDEYALQLAEYINKFNPDVKVTSITVDKHSVNPDDLNNIFGIKVK